MRRLTVSSVSLIMALLVALLTPRAARGSVAVDEEEVVFRLSVPAGRRVFLVGDFNGWNPTMDRMIERDGAHELRLFLLPGMYRYRFIVDGVSLPDPDNPHRDADGNSFFIFRERDGRYEIVFEEKGGEGVGMENLDAAISGEGVLTAREGTGTSFLRGSAALTVDEHVAAVLAVAHEYTVSEENEPRGEAYLLSGSAEYRMETGVVTAFSRDASLGLGDPLETFGTVGPYGYPVGLFCRGIGYEGEIPRLARARLIYASRIDGYLTGLESSSSTGDPFASRDPTDADMLAAAIGRRIGPLALYYLYRRDHRPKTGAWSFGDVLERAYRGYEKTRLAGAWMTLEGPEGFVLELEYLDGGSFLVAQERRVGEAAAFEPYDLERRWEEGRRYHLACTFRRERFDARVALRGMTLEGEPALRGERPGGGCTTLSGEVGFRSGDIACRAGARTESYSAGNTGGIFWLRRYNFWLDGDRLTVDRLPFVTSRSLGEIHLDLGWREDAEADDPYRTGLHLSMMRRMDGNDPHRGVTELVFREGLPVGPRLTHILDMRYVSYDHAAWRGKRRFTDFFTALHLRIAPSAWVAVGAGVNPHIFDRWRYRFTGYGRELYLIERGVLAPAGTQDQTEILRALERAEEALAEEWSFVVEAHVRF